MTNTLDIIKEKLYELKRVGIKPDFIILGRDEFFNLNLLLTPFVYTEDYYINKLFDIAVINAPIDSYIGFSCLPENNAP